MTPLLELLGAYVVIMWAVMSFVATGDNLAGYTAREKVVVILRSPLDWPAWQVARLWGNFKFNRKVKQLAKEWGETTDEIVVTTGQELVNLLGSPLLRGKVIQVPQEVDLKLSRVLEVKCSGCVVHMENVTLRVDFHPCLRLLGDNNALLQPSLMFPHGYPNIDTMALRGTHQEVFNGVDCLVETEDDRNTLLAEVCIYEEEPDETTE